LVSLGNIRLSWSFINIQSDDIYSTNSDANEEPRLSILGGSGTTGAIGARIVSPGQMSRKVGWVVDCGSDFPQSARNTIDSWNITTLMRHRDTPTARARIEYLENEFQSKFELLTPSVPIEAEDLDDDMLQARTFHFFGNPVKCLSICKGILARQSNLNTKIKPSSTFIYEPRPADAVPDQLDNIINILQVVQNFSPNHFELVSIFGKTSKLGESGFDTKIIEECASDLLNRIYQSRTDFCLIVRAGQNGCYLADSTRKQWFPAYYGLDKQDKVISSTGAGNAFLGALAVTLSRTSDIQEACIVASVSASYLVEQVGLPNLEQHAGGVETWNGSNVQSRLDEFRKRCQSLE